MKPKRSKKAQAAILGILSGQSDAEVAEEVGLSERSVKRLRREVLSQGIDLECGVVSTQEAAWVLGVTDRRVRAICQEGRLGRRVGQRSYWIAIPELVDFAKLDRPAGWHGWEKNRQVSSA